jgi:hypothetical protein
MLWHQVPPNYRDLLFSIWTIINLFYLKIQLRYNPKVPVIQRPQIICSEDAYKQFLLLMDQTQFNIREEEVVLFLNRNNRILGGYILPIVGITGTYWLSDSF